MWSKWKGFVIGVAVLVILVAGIYAWNSRSNAPSPANTSLKGEPKPNNNSSGKVIVIPDLQLAAKKVAANELGLIPILVYHQIGEQEGRWTRTPENFRRDLQELYNRNYILIPLNDYLHGNMEVPSGKSPAVITFDDSTIGQFRLLEKNGENIIDPNSAVGLLLDFDKQHPGFGHAATFFVNGQPFGQNQLWQKKLQLLNQNGFEIGNHTYSHKYLKALSPAQVADEIARMQAQIAQAIPGYQPKSFAIPQDGVPAAYNTLLSGEVNGIKYKHDGVVLWAWSAALSPFNKDFNATRVQRIQVFQDNGVSSLINWLERIKAKRYISDGESETLSIPNGWKGTLQQNSSKKLNIYQPDKPQRTPDKEKQAEQARGLHVTFSYASSQDRRDKILALIKNEHLNTIQLDIKDESGRIGYQSTVKMAQEIGSGRKMMPIRAFLEELKANNIYSIGRIVIFRDPYLAQKKPQLMVKDNNGKPLLKGNWVDPYSREIWDYNIALAEEAYELGFDEVQFDYIRFPENSRTATYGSNDGRKRVDVIADLLRTAREKIGWERTLSSTIFGFAGFAIDDLGIGQRPERFAPYLDYLSPMVYPSHYSTGNYGFSSPNAHPYEVVDGSIKDIEKLIDYSGCKQRPWLQAFTLGPPTYGSNEVDAQIKAAKDNNVDTWLLWNPGVNYSKTI